MNALTVVLSACACALVLTCAAQADPAEPALEWHDAAKLKIEGKGWTDTESPFDRLPARALDKVSDSVKGLSKQSAGMAIRFRTDSGICNYPDHWYPDFTLLFYLHYSFDFRMAANQEQGDSFFNFND